MLRTRNAKKISIYKETTARFPTLRGEWQSLGTYLLLTWHTSRAPYGRIRSEQVREKESRGGMKRERYFRRRRNFRRFPPRRFSSTGFSTSYTRDTPYVPPPRSGRREISSMEINFRSTGATGRALVCARVSTWRAEHFRSHAPIAPETR